MKQSKYDPTLKEHFSEEEARRWIRHLEKVIDSLEHQKQFEIEKRRSMYDRFQKAKIKYERLLTHLEYLQEKYPDIEMGLDTFIRWSQADQE